MIRLVPSVRQEKIKSVVVPESRPATISNKRERNGNKLSRQGEPAATRAVLEQTPYQDRDDSLYPIP